MSDGTGERSGERASGDPIESVEEYLAGIDDGAGCVEVWEELSDQRDDD